MHSHTHTGTPVPGTAQASVGPVPVPVAVPGARSRSCAHNLTSGRGPAPVGAGGEPMGGAGEPDVTGTAGFAHRFLTVMMCVDTGMKLLANKEGEGLKFSLTRLTDHTFCMLGN